MTSLYNQNVDLYDIAFHWDLSEEIDWLLSRFGKTCNPLLEPGCGSGRMLEAFAQRGIDITGIDISRQAVATANQRLVGLPGAGSALVGDMVKFDLGKKFAGAVCPINTLSHLTPKQLTTHFQTMARHLKPDGRYLIQLAIRDSIKPDYVGNRFEWEENRGDTKLTASVTVDEVDPTQSRELQSIRIEVTAGKRAGEIVQDKHWMTTWKPDAWKAIIDASPFQQSGQYDGDLDERPRVEIGTPGNLMWHELIRP